MQQSELAAKEYIKREKARKSIYHYINYMKDTGLLDLKFKPAAHHKIIIDDLHCMIKGDWFKEVFELPPGAAKSTYISVILPTFLMCSDPTLQILCISAGETLAEDFARRRRAIYRSEQWRRLAATALAPDAQGLANMRTKLGGTNYAAGAGSTIQGLRADWLIMDDLVKGFEQAENVGQLDKIWNWLLSEARSRLKPGGRELIVATRWSALDPIGRALELRDKGSEDWKEIRIPMECDSEDDPLQREMGEMLWTEWFTEEMVADAKRNPAIWQCLYQQRPITSIGEWCPIEHIHIVKSKPKILKYVVGVDIALTITDKSDWTVFAVFGVDVGHDLILVDLYRKQRTPDRTAMDLLSLCEAYDPTHVFIEDDNASKVFMKLVFEQAKNHSKVIPLQMVKMGNKDKEVRASPLRSYFLQDRISILQSPWNTDLLDEISKFPVVHHDDQVDAMGVAASQLVRIAAPRSPSRPVNRPETHIGVQDGKLVMNESLNELFEAKEKGGRRFSKLRI